MKKLLIRATMLLLTLAFLVAVPSGRRYSSCLLPLLYDVALYLGDYIGSANQQP